MITKQKKFLVVKQILLTCFLRQASRVFFLAWLLACAESFVSQFVICIVGLDSREMFFTGGTHITMFLVLLLLIFALCLFVLPA